MLRAIIVSEEQNIRSVFKNISALSQEVIVVGCASRLCDGYALFKLLKSDVVFVDMHECGDEDIYLLEKMKKISLQVQIVIFTTNREIESAYKLFKVGVSNFILKPFSTIEIEETLQTCKNNLSSCADYFNLCNLVKTKNDSDSRLVCACLNYLEVNYGETVTLECLANEMYVSSCHLSRLIKKNTGHNFVEILNGVRIKKAQELLQYTNFSISKISKMVGFFKSSYFSFVFKKYSNQTPRDFRKLKKINKNNILQMNQIAFSKF